MGFFGRGDPYPLLDGIVSCLRQDRVSAFDPDCLRETIWRDHSFHLHASLALHTTGKVGILRSHSGYNLAVPR